MLKYSIPVSVPRVGLVQESALQLWQLNKSKLLVEKVLAIPAMKETALLRSAPQYLELWEFGFLTSLQLCAGAPLPLHPFSLSSRDVQLSLSFDRTVRNF